MPERLLVHPVDPQPRSIARATTLLQAGGLGLCPTDAGYTLVWMLESREAEERVRRMRALDTKHPFTVL
ncbi:MAG TPA: Sua5/YciO/YrdC/YwlC family protein, partial [Xanthomonadaceae bacterium]|nr:Sua5/YciO/YrdC/YwlC family protein [Xanthomonadaceae bacterium]